MTNEQVKTLTGNAMNRLMDELAGGQSNTLKEYLGVMARFHHYSFGNCLLIFGQRPQATHVAGFHTWLKLGRYVRKGEKGIAILAPMVGHKRTNGELVEDEQTRLFGFRQAYVFDVAQTEGDPLPEFATVKGDPRCFTDRLKDFIKQRDIELEFTSSIAPAKGTSFGGRIAVLPNLQPAETFSVLVHETAHELLHKAERRASTTHAIRETEAEAVTYVVNSSIGLDTTSANADYILLHAGDAATLAESFDLIQRTSHLLIQAIHRKEAESDSAGG